MDALEVSIILCSLLRMVRQGEKDNQDETLNLDKACGKVNPLL